MLAIAAIAVIVEPWFPSTPRHFCRSDPFRVGATPEQRVFYNADPDRRGRVGVREEEVAQATGITSDPRLIRGVVTATHGDSEGLSVAMEPTWALSFRGPRSLAEAHQYKSRTGPGGRFQFEVPSEAFPGGTAFFHVASSDRTTTYYEGVRSILGDVRIYVKGLEHPDWSASGTVSVEGPSEPPFRILVMSTEVSRPGAGDWLPVAMASFEKSIAHIELRGIVGPIMEARGRMKVLLSRESGAPLASLSFPDVDSLSSSLSTGWRFRLQEYTLNLAAEGDMPAIPDPVLKYGFPIESNFTPLAGTAHERSDSAHIVCASSEEFLVEQRSLESASVKRVGRWTAGNSRVEWLYSLPANRQLNIHVERKASAEPIAKAHIRYTSTGSSAHCYRHSGQVFTDDDGRATVFLLGDAAYTLSVDPPRGWAAEYGRTTSHIGPGRRRDVRLSVGDGANVFFGFNHYPPTEEALGEHTILARHGSSPWSESRLGFPYTSFSLAMEQGPWHIIAFSGGYFGEAWIDVVSGDGPQKVGLDLYKMRRFRGSVMTEKYDPASLIVTVGPGLDGFGALPWCESKVKEDGSFDIWITPPSYDSLWFWSGKRVIAKRPIPANGAPIRID